MTELYVVKHVADRVANEPRNVGVIAATGRGADSRVATRFLGVDLDRDVGAQAASRGSQEHLSGLGELFPGENAGGPLGGHCARPTAPSPGLLSRSCSDDSRQ